MSGDPGLRPGAKAVSSSAQTDQERRATDLLQRLAGNDGQRLRAWLDKAQRDRMNVPEPAERWLSEWEGGSPPDVDKLDFYYQADVRGRIARNATGKPIGGNLVDEMASLATWATASVPLSAWEARPSAERRRRTASAAKLATALANLLALPDGPEWPAAIDLFEVQNVPHVLRLQLNHDPLSKTLRPLRSQTVGPALLRLAEFAQRESRRPVRDARPKTGTPNARTLARDVSFWFDLRYGRVPNEVVADIVNLLMVLDPPADEDSVREWRGAKRGSK